MTKNSICRQLLPGHEDDHIPSSPRILYNGLAQLHWDGHGGDWSVRLPPGTKLDAEAGDQLHVTLKEGP